jgi:cytochrome c peroxidase
MKKTLYSLVLTVIIFSCNKKDWTEPNEEPTFKGEKVTLNLPESPFSYQRELPEFLKISGIIPQPVSDQKATLGRVLFYDKNLSADRSISCASCHKQELAFSDDKAFSTGVYKAKTSRNSMPLANISSFSAYYGHGGSNAQQLLWDNRAHNVAQQATLAFLNEHEMGMKLDEIAERVREQEYLRLLWQKTYQHQEPNIEEILECLTAFVGAMGSHNSKLDQSLTMALGSITNLEDTTTIQQAYYGISVNILPEFNFMESIGRQLFIENCTKCHSPILPFQTITEACNGLDLTSTDIGKGAITLQAKDFGVFKSPSLRNIALTAPYMHDGRFKDLEEVIEFYSMGVKEHPNLHPEMIKNGSVQRNFNEIEKAALVQFLHTLTDKDVASDERFSNPFGQ